MTTTQYHISPKTGKIGVCKAEIRGCRFGKQYSSPTQAAHGLINDLVKMHPLLPVAHVQRSGLNKKSNELILHKLQEDSAEFLNSLDRNERNILGRYTTSSFRHVNNYLIGGKDYIASVYLKRKKTPLEEDFLESQVGEAERSIPVLDKIFAQYNQAKETKNPQLLYRAFRVLPPSGIKKTRPKDIKKYVEENYQIGSKVVNKSYTSTSLDSDYMLVSAHDEPEQLIVHEIVSKTGVPVYKKYGEHNKSIQNAEKEVIIPRDTTFRVVNVINSEFVSSYPDHDMLPFNLYGRKMPKNKKFTVIQMVEE
jgi:hypothetical protein